jgi:hypothetical protein
MGNYSNRECREPVRLANDFHIATLIPSRTKLIHHSLDIPKTVNCFA